MYMKLPCNKQGERAEENQWNREFYKKFRSQSTRDSGKLNRNSESGK